MYTLIAQNKFGQQLELTHNDAYVIEDIDGLNPPDATINTTRNANADGSVFNSSYVNNRQVIITMAINGPAESNRIQLYKYFKNKYPVRLFYRNNTRQVYIDGYCKNIDINFFNQKQIAQITIICPEPFFNGSMNGIFDFSSVTPLFEFPFSVEDPPGEIEFGEILIAQERDILNAGDVETGAEIYLNARGPLTNPTIYNAETNEFFKLNLSMLKGDEIYINTKKKQKKVELTRNGATTNIIGNLVNGSTWFVFNPGDNLFIITADTNPENLDAYCLMTNQYEGV
jgi:predicted phage tail component-like protein